MLALLKNAAISLLLLAVLAPTAWGEDNFRIIPYLSAVGAETLTVTYEPPCGAIFQGIVYSEQQDGIHVGVLVKQPQLVACAGLEESHTATLDARLTKGQAISPLVTEVDDDLEVIPATRSVQTATGLESYFTGCGEYLGTTFFPSGSGNLVRAGHILRRDEKPSPVCQDTDHIVTFKSLDFANNIKLSEFVAKKPDLKSGYLIQIAAVKPGSLKVQDGKISLKYMKRCNVQPVGLVLTKTGKVSLLTAFFYNQSCDAKAQWTDYESKKHFDEKAYSKLSLLERKGKTRSDLQIRTPEIIQTTNGTKLAYYTSCNEGMVGLLIQDSPNRPTKLGLLTLNKTKQCKKGFKKSDLRVNYLKSDNELQPFVI
jgi:hypothetical protein